MRASLALLLLSSFFFSLSLSTNIVSVVPDANSLSPHHTGQYRFNASKPLVVRRGLAFILQVTTDQALAQDETLTLSLEPSKTTLDVTVEHEPNNLNLMHVTPSVSAAVFEYGLQIHVTKGGQVTSTFKFPASFIILFNPYNEADAVYMPTQTDLQEYIENEHGMIWQGSAEEHSKQKWYYAQFNENSLRSALHLLTLYQGDTSDPVGLARYLTYASTYQQANPAGLLVGNWGSSYAGGTSPLAWTGTNQVLDQYVNSGFKPVKYGQCWVFGGVLNTLLRTLGIPSRQLITFGSGHEQPQNGKYRQIIEYHYNQNKRMVYSVGSIWNFHSWNEMWLHRRGDSLPGWQAVDATPQEMSDGAFRMGPAAVDAVKNYNETALYDVPFVRSEVASTLEVWLDQCSGRNCKPVKMLSNDTQTGDLILTPTVGSDEGNEITWNYKKKPVNSTFNPRLALFRHSGLSVDTKFIQMVAGEDIKALIKLSSGRDLQVELTVGVYLIHYNGILVSDQALKMFQSTHRLGSSNSYTSIAEITIPVEEYHSVIRDNHLLFAIFAEVGNDLQVVQKQASLIPPRIRLHVGPKEVHVNHLPFPVEPKQTVPITLTFTNPYPHPLKDVSLSLTTGEMELGLDKNVIEIGTIPPKETLQKVVEVTLSKKPGKHSFIAHLVSDKLVSHGFVDFVAF